VVLADVPVTSMVHDSQEHEKKEIYKARHETLETKLRWTSAFYVGSIVFMAVVPGFILHPFILFLYLLSGLLVAFTAVRGITGQLLTPILQGGLSVAILYCFPQSLQPSLLYMLTGHIVIPGIFYFCVDSYKSQF